MAKYLTLLCDLCVQRLKKKGGVEEADAPGGDEEGEGVKVGEEEGSVDDELLKEEADKRGEGIESELMLKCYFNRSGGEEKENERGI